MRRPAPRYPPPYPQRRGVRRPHGLGTARAARGGFRQLSALSFPRRGRPSERPGGRRMGAVGEEDRRARRPAAGRMGRSDAPGGRRRRRRHRHDLLVGRTRTRRWTSPRRSPTCASRSTRTAASRAWSTLESLRGFHVAALSGDVCIDRLRAGGVTPDRHLSELPEPDRRRRRWRAEDLLHGRPVRRVLPVQGRRLASAFAKPSSCTTATCTARCGAAMRPRCR